MVVGGNEDEPIRTIAHAIQDPKSFWGQVEDRVETNAQHQLVDSAFKSYKRGGWPWDRAFMQAAAYLSTTEGISSPRNITLPPMATRDFPFWVAIDKHTDEGKQVLRELAGRKGVKYRELSWANFYFESAITNHEEPSPWWDKEITWRLRKAGLSLKQPRNYG